MYGEYENGQLRDWEEDLQHKPHRNVSGEEQHKTGLSDNGGEEEGGGYFAMDILAMQMPGLYADHGESGWYNEDIWRQLEPCPYDPMGDH